MWCNERKGLAIIFVENIEKKSRNFIYGQWNSFSCIRRTLSNFFQFNFKRKKEEKGDEAEGRRKDFTFIIIFIVIKNQALFFWNHY